MIRRPPRSTQSRSSAASDVYKRQQLWRDAIALKKPAHVPITPWIGLFPMRYSGFTGHDGYYDYDKLAQAWDKYHADFQPDALAMTLAMVPGKLFDILDYKMYDWPGHGTEEDTSYQYNEREWMKDDEYDLLINDPSNYWQRYYCLLYTSDAADDLLCVDLGGRRIIKK